MLVIAPPGLWRDSLRVSLEARYRVAVIDEVGDVTSAQKFYQQNQTNLILLDANLPEPLMVHFMLLEPHFQCG